MCRRATVHGAVVSLLAFVALALVGCGTTKKTPTSSAAAIGVNGRPIGKLSTPGTPKGEQTVRIEVIAKTGTQRAALALVPVYVHNRGPFLFALDTGASRSLVSSGLVRELHLPQVGPARVIRGITGAGLASVVQVENWAAGKVQLPTSRLDAMLPPANSGPEAEGAPPSHLRGAVGLLGSDVLSRYGKIAVDYDRDLLILDPPVR